MSATTALRRGANGSAVKALCIVVHGRGQSPEAMESHILARLDAPGVAFSLPRAARGSWYDARAIDPLTDLSRAQLGEGLDQLGSDIGTLRSEFPGVPLLLAGFSQGACLAIEYVCRGDAPPDALLALTGCRVGTPACGRPDDAPHGLPGYLSGSNADPWIPLEAMCEAALSLGGRGMKLRTDVFPGRAHEVSDAEIAMLQSMLADMAAGRSLGQAAGR